MKKLLIVFIILSAALIILTGFLFNQLLEVEKTVSQDQCNSQNLLYPDEYTTACNNGTLYVIDYANNKIVETVK